MEAVDSASPIRAVILGAVLGRHPKNIARGGEEGLVGAVAMAVFVLVGSATVVGAVLFYLVAGRRAERPLAAVNFVAANSGVILAVVLLIVGVKLLVDGAAAI